MVRLRPNILLCGCAAVLAVAAAQAGPLRAPWVHVPLKASKPITQYQTVEEADPAAGASAGSSVDSQAGTVMLTAVAERSASLAVQPVNQALGPHTRVHWRWKIEQQPAKPDVSVAAREDAAARLVLFFDGDESALPWHERLMLAAARKVGSQPLPYATLMYVSAPGREVGTVISNPYTRRIQMVVVDGNEAHSPKAWRTFSRDVAKDFQKAFGEAPGRLLGWGFMTDADNTASRAEAIYGSVRWSTER